MTPVLALIIVTLAAARVTRFLTIDKLAEPYRLWVAKKFPPAENAEEQRRITYLVFCPWCTGIWVCIPASIIVWFAAVDQCTSIPGWIAVPAIWLGMAQATGLLIRGND
ncbi:membrane protein [Gordonia phage Clawz]|uniref:Membrane protein n=1 Tax=Gordonia phage Clawz TaxID=2743910 RepID=A0AAE7F9M5_9CAUD|nr:membrane protein [Gordonia phage Clawz]QKY79952.1 membrane protein [Gordonia phage Clawz]